MRYGIIDPGLFINNRKKFAKLLKPGSIAIFNSNDVMPKSADGVMPFKQNSDLFYLTGIDQEETILILFPDHRNEEFREIVFTRKTDHLIAIWEGDKLTQAQATEVSGIENAKWTSDFKSVLKKLIAEADYVYLNHNEHARHSSEVETRDDRFRKWCFASYPSKKYLSAAPMMHEIRQIKEKEEIKLLKKAIDITEKAFRRLLDKTGPGKYEFELEAEMLHEFLRHRSRGHAFDPIIASGKNACVLHYIENNARIQDGDMILLDFGAEFANYNADLTRCIPANGKYSVRQKEIYDAVHGIQKFAISQLTPGNTIAVYNKTVIKLIEDQLIALGLLTQSDIENQDPKSPAYRKYFMHGISHSLGLDVHDVDVKGREFEAGMVYTCEPGIYVREEGIGVRIENDILITESGNEDLMVNIPVNSDEIEQLMSS